jgi:hypothetical protein
VDVPTLHQRTLVSLVSGRPKSVDREIEGRAESPVFASLCLGFPARDLLISGVQAQIFAESQCTG